MTRSQLATTSSAVMGVPSLNVMPGRSGMSGDGRLRTPPIWARGRLDLGPRVDVGEALPDLGEDGRGLGITRECQVAATVEAPAMWQSPRPRACGGDVADVAVG